MTAPTDRADQKAPRAVMTRRRCLAVVASIAGAAAAPGLASARALQRYEWRGVALGAEARLVLYHDDVEAARHAARAASAEVERLEAEFSLYRADSAIRLLNRNKELPAASVDMRDLLTLANRISALSGGRFDVTVQPLWVLYARHFAQEPAPSSGPSEGAIAQARKRVGYDRLTVSDSAVRLPPDMEITLNGIAQGYITDRVADLLRRLGWANVLIDMGELRALGAKPDGSAWSLALAHPQAPGQAQLQARLTDGAIATSAGSGTPLSPDGRFHHLLNPLTGRPCNAWGAVTVTAASATLADAVSTALAVGTAAEARALLAQAPIERAWLTDRRGDTHMFLGQGGA